MKNDQVEKFTLLFCFVNKNHWARITELNYRIKATIRVEIKIDE